MDTFPAILPSSNPSPTPPPADVPEDPICIDLDEEVLLQQELATDRECYHLSNEDGWYYPDTGPDD